MNPKPALFLLALPLGAALAQNTPATPAPAAQNAPGNAVTPGSILAAQVTAIVETPGLSDESKQRQIAAAIRQAIGAALTKVTDPQQAATIVLDLSAAAATAAPQFADTIVRTVTAVVGDLPLLAGQAGLVDSIRETVRVAADNAAGADGAGADTVRARRDAAEFKGRTDDVIVSPSN